MKSSICIEVEFLAGTDIESAILEAKQKADQWDVAFVKFSFNGANFSIGRNADVYEAAEEFRNTSGKPYGIVSA